MKLIREIEATGRLSEVYQQQGIKFAFVARGFRTVSMLHEFVLCRDYLHDQVFATIYAEQYPAIANIQAHGDISLYRLHLMVLVDDGMKSKLYEALPLLNEFERRCGLVQTTITPIEDHPDKLYLRSSGKWLTNTITFSIYSHLIRIMSGTGSLKQNTVEDLLEVFRAGTVPSNNLVYEGRIFQQVDIYELMSNITVLTRGLERVECEIPEHMVDGAHTAGIYTFSWILEKMKEGISMDAQFLMLAYPGFVNRYITILKDKGLKGWKEN